MAVIEKKKENNIHEGYMFVQSNSVWRPWSMKAKYFILTNEYLYCFKRRGDLEAIPCDVIKLDGTAVTIDEERRGMRKRYYIRLTTQRPRKSLNLFCFMLEERNTWLTNILSVLAGKFTDKGLASLNNTTPKSETLNVSSRKISGLKGFRDLEHSKTMSISCMELTNLSVMPGPLSPSRSAIPIRKILEVPEISLKKKISSSSLDIAIRTDISLNTREYYSKNNNIDTIRKNNLKNKFLDTERFSNNKRPKSMTDLRYDINDLPPTLSNTSPTLKRTRKSKGLSLAMIGNTLSFRTASVSDLF